MRCGLTLLVNVSLSAMQLRCANMAERIEVLLGLETLGDPRNIVLDTSLDFPHVGFTKLL